MINNYSIGIEVHKSGDKFDENLEVLRLLIDIIKEKELGAVEVTMSWRRLYVSGNRNFFEKPAKDYAKSIADVILAKFDCAISITCRLPSEYENDDFRFGNWKN